MARFYYRALSAKGEPVEGETEAADRRSAVLSLQNQGLMPIETVPVKGKVAGPVGKNRQGHLIHKKETTVLLRELETLLSAGEPVDRSLALLVDEIDNKKLQEYWRRVLAKIRSGEALSTAMRGEPKIFSKLAVALVKSGEATGRLSDAIKEIVAVQTKEEESREEAIKALTYPAVLCVVAVGAVLVILLLVVPQFADLFQGYEDQLPVSAAITMNSALWLKEHLKEITIALLVVLMGGAILGSSADIRAQLDRAMLSIPGLRRFETDMITAQFSRGLASMLKGGLDLPTAMGLSLDLVSNQYAQKQLRNALGSVRQGKKLAASLQEQKVLARMGIKLIKTGEESGKLADMAAYLASQFERRIKERRSRFLSLLEPALVVVLGIVVGGVVMSVLSALLSVNQIAV